MTVTSSNEMMKVKSNAVTRPERASGSAMPSASRRSSAPSSEAASTISPSIRAMATAIGRQAKGSVTTTWAATMPPAVPRWPVSASTGAFTA